MDKLNDDDKSLANCIIKEEPTDDYDKEVSPLEGIAEGQIRIKEELPEENELPETDELLDINVKQEVPHYSSADLSASVLNVSNVGSLISQDHNHGFSQVDYIPSYEFKKTYLYKNNIRLATGSTLRRLMRKYLCNYCNYSTAYMVSMRIHCEKHNNPSNDKVSCLYCDAMMNSYSEYETHVQANHPDVKLHRCDWCSYSSNFRGSLNRHILMVHELKNGSVEQFKCEHCSFKCAYRPSLYAHIKRKHTSKDPYPCSVCDMRFTTIIKLKQHILVKHESEKPFKCSSCDYVCKSDNGLKSHIKKKHKSNIIKEINSSMLTLT